MNIDDVIHELLTNDEKVKLLQSKIENFETSKHVTILANCSGQLRYIRVQNPLRTHYRTWNVHSVFVTIWRVRNLQIWGYTLLYTRIIACKFQPDRIMSSWVLRSKLFVQFEGINFRFLDQEFLPKKPTCHNPIGLKFAGYNFGV